mgnify:CR=1 FL=1
MAAAALTGRERVLDLYCGVGGYLKKGTPDEVAAGHSGITGHLQITKSGVGGAAGSHTDPGTEFPWGRYMRYVHSFSNGHIPLDFVHGETH